MPVVKYNPFNDVEDFPAGFRLFQDTVNRILSDNTTRPWSPAVDICETEHDLLLTADLPGVEMSDLDVRLENGTLSLKGERKFEQTENRKGYHRIERGYGSFARYFTLPDSIDPEKVRADFKNGVLTVTLPKKEAAKPRAIKVELNQKASA